MSVSSITPAGQHGASLHTQKEQPSISSEAVLNIAEAALKPPVEGFSCMVYRNRIAGEVSHGYLPLGHNGTNNPLVEKIPLNVNVHTKVILKNIYEEIFEKELLPYFKQNGGGSSLLSAFGQISPSKSGQQTVIGGRLDGSSVILADKHKKIDDKIATELNHDCVWSTIASAIQKASDTASHANSNIAKSRLNCIEDRGWNFVATENKKIDDHQKFSLECKPVSFCDDTAETIINFLSVKETTSSDVRGDFVTAMKKVLKSDDLNLEETSEKRLLRRFKTNLEDSSRVESQFLKWFVDKELSRARIMAYRQSMNIIVEHSKYGNAKEYFEHIKNAEETILLFDEDELAKLTPSIFSSVQSTSSEPFVLNLSQAAKRLWENQPYKIEQHEQFYEEYRFDGDKDDGVSTRLQNVKVKLNNAYTSTDYYGIDELKGTGLLHSSCEITSYENKVIKSYLKMVRKTRSIIIKDANGNRADKPYVDEREFGWGAINLASLALVPKKLFVSQHIGILDLSDINKRIDYLNEWLGMTDENLFYERALNIALALVHVDTRSRLSEVQKDIRDTLTDLHLVEKSIKPAICDAIKVKIRVSKNLIDRNGILTGDMSDVTDTSFNFICGNESGGKSGWWQYISYETITGDTTDTEDGDDCLFSTLTEFNFSFRPMCISKKEQSSTYNVERNNTRSVLTIIHDCPGKQEYIPHTHDILDAKSQKRVDRRSFTIAHPEAKVLTCHGMIEYWEYWCKENGHSDSTFRSSTSKEAKVLFGQAFALSMMVYNFLISRITNTIAKMANDICERNRNAPLDQVLFLRLHPEPANNTQRVNESSLYELGNDNYSAMVYTTARRLENELGIKTHIQGAKLNNLIENSFARTNISQAVLSKHNVSLRGKGSSLVSYADRGPLPDVWVIAFSLRDAVHYTMPEDDDKKNKELRYWHQTIEVYKTSSIVDRDGKTHLTTTYQGSYSDIVSEVKPGGTRTLGTSINAIIADIRNRSEGQIRQPKIVMVSKMLYSKKLGGAKEEVFRSITQQFVEYTKNTFDDLDIIKLNVHDLSGVRSLNADKKGKNDFFYELVSDNQFVSIADHLNLNSNNQESVSYIKKQQVLCSFATAKTIAERNNKYTQKIHSTAVSYIYESDTRVDDKELHMAVRELLTQALRSIHILNAEKRTIKLNALGFLRPANIQDVGEMKVSYGEGYGSLVVNLPAFLHAMHLHSIDNNRVEFVEETAKEEQAVQTQLF